MSRLKEGACFILVINIITLVSIVLSHTIYCVQQKNTAGYEKEQETVSHIKSINSK